MKKSVERRPKHPAGPADVSQGARGRQRDMMRPVYCTFHILTFAIYSYTLYFDTYQLQINIGRDSYGGRSKFLTFWNLVLQWLFFGYSICNDFFGSNLSREDLHGVADRRTALQRVRDLLAAGIIFPIGTFVVVTFWSIYAVDRDMIFPKELDKLIPSWLNHVWHSTVIVFLLIEKCLVYHHYPSRRTGLTLCLGFGSIYQIWIFWIAYAVDIWVYPILEAFNWPLRLVFIAACWVLLCATYRIGEFTTYLFWRGRQVARQEEHGRRKTN